MFNENLKKYFKLPKEIIDTKSSLLFDFIAKYGFDKDLLKVEYFNKSGVETVSLYVLQPELAQTFQHVLNIKSGSVTTLDTNIAEISGYKVFDNFKPMLLPNGDWYTGDSIDGEPIGWGRINNGEKYVIHSYVIGSDFKISPKIKNIVDPKVNTINEYLKNDYIEKQNKFEAKAFDLLEKLSIYKLGDIVPYEELSLKVDDRFNMIKLKDNADKYEIRGISYNYGGFSIKVKAYHSNKSLDYETYFNVNLAFLENNEKRSFVNEFKKFIVEESLFKAKKNFLDKKFYEPLITVPKNNESSFYGEGKINFPACSVFFDDNNNKKTLFKYKVKIFNPEKNETIKCYLESNRINIKGFDLCSFEKVNESCNELFVFNTQSENKIPNREEKP